MAGKWIKNEGKQNTSAAIQKKALRALAGFLALMVLFTLLSRAASNQIVPNVVVETPGKESLSYRISASGTVKENQLCAVNVASGIRVKKVLVNAGDRVEKGDLLLELDPEDLAEKILMKEREIQKMELGIQGYEAGQERKQSDQELERRRAGEDYQRVERSADTQVERAEKAMQEAKSRLEEFDRSAESGDFGEAEDPVEKTLQDTCREKAELLQQAETEWKEKQEELQKTEAAASQTADSASEAGSGPQTPASSGQTGSSLEQLQKAVKEAEERKEAAGREKEEADAALAQYQAERESREGQADASQRQALEDAYTQAKNAYEDAVRQREDSLTDAERKKEDAAKQTLPDSTVKSQTLDLQILQIELGRMRELESSQGRIVSPIKGVVRKVNAEPGFATSDGSTVSLADLSEGCRFVAALSAEDAKYLAKGDEVILTPTAGNEEIKGLTVDSMKESPEDPEQMEITVEIRDGEMEIGESATLSLEKKSPRYPCTLPLAAIHLDGNQSYVLILQEEKTVLGTELTAARVDVEILEKNQQLAVLKEGALTGSQQVIISSDKPIEAGSRVRPNKE